MPRLFDCDPLRVHYLNVCAILMSFWITFSCILITGNYFLITLDHFFTLWCFRGQCRTEPQGEPIAFLLCLIFLAIRVDADGRSSRLMRHLNLSTPFDECAKQWQCDVPPRMASDHTRAYDRPTEAVRKIGYPPRHYALLNNCCHSSAFTSKGI